MSLVVDTQQIFDELKEPLGDIAARTLSRTFATVYEELRDAVTRQDFRILRESIDDNISRLDQGLATLAEAQARTERRLETLAGDVSQLTAAQRVTEQALSRLVESQGQMQQALTRPTIRTDSVVGRTLELQFATASHRIWACLYGGAGLSIRPH